MKYIILTVLFLFSVTSFAQDFVGKGPGGSTLEVKAAYGIVPYAHVKIKDRDYNFYYKGNTFSMGAGLSMSPFSILGLYYQQMDLENEKNEGANEETLRVGNLGIYSNWSLPIPIRPFFELGFGLVLSEIEQKGTNTEKHQYTSGYGGRASIGFAPNFGGIGFYLKWEGQYYLHRGGEDKNNTSTKLFNLSQDSYAVMAGISLTM